MEMVGFIFWPISPAMAVFSVAGLIKSSLSRIYLLLPVEIDGFGR
jgi:hypothetical protein